MFPWKEKQTFLLSTDIKEFWCLKPDPNLITLSFCKEVSSFQEHTKIFSFGWYSHVVFNVISFFAHGLTSFVCLCWKAILHVFHPRGKKKLKNVSPGNLQVQSHEMQQEISGFVKPCPVLRTLTFYKEILNFQYLIFKHCL